MRHCNHDHRALCREPESARRVARPLAQRPGSPRIAAACLALALCGPSHALDFDVVAMSGHTVLPFAGGPGTQYAFGLRQATIADDGWVGFAPSSAAGGPASAFMLGVPGQVHAVVSAGQSVSSTTLATLRALRIGDDRRVALSASPAGSIVLHFGSANLALAPVQRLAASGIVYNRSASPSGPMNFELLADGSQLVAAATSSGTTYETGRVDAAGTYTPWVQSNVAASRALPTSGWTGVGTAAAGRTLASAQAVGATPQGSSFVYGLQSGSGLTIDGAQARGNLVVQRADGSRHSLVHPGSSVPGVAQPSQGINANLAQFASAGHSVVWRNDFGRNTTAERKLVGAIVRADAAVDAATGSVSVVALPGAVVPGLVSSSNGSVSFGHKVGVDSSSGLAPLSMLPDNLVEDSVRGLAVNTAGTVAFASPVTAAPAAAGFGVFLARADGRFETLATSGSVTAGQAPGTDGTFGKFHDVALNDRGLVVFSATLAGAGNRQGYWYGTSAGDLQLLVLEGQTLEVLPGVFKTVHDLSTSLRTLDDTRITALDDGLGNDGHFAFSVIFSDGSEAVLRTPLVAVPEPTSAAILVSGLALVGGWRARRRLT